MVGLSTEIHKGMDVYDRKNDHIGKVEDVRFGEAEAAARPSETGRRRTLIDDIADAFTTTELPEALRARMEREGYVELDVDGLLRKDRFILPDQIATVTGDRLVLSVTRDELAKTP